jgi:hypothetical protein
LIGEVDWIRCTDVDGGVVGDIWDIVGIAMLFFLRAIGGRGGLATNESMDTDDGIDVWNADNDSHVEEIFTFHTDTTLTVAVGAFIFLPRPLRDLLFKTISSCLSTTTTSIVLLWRALVRVDTIGCSCSLTGELILTGDKFNSIDLIRRAPRRFEVAG